MLADGEMPSGQVGNSGDSTCAVCGGREKLHVRCTDCQSPNTKKRRLKSVALLLAAAFGGWAWLYTYRVSRAKFWSFVVVWCVDLLVPAIIYANFAFSFESVFDAWPAIVTYLTSAAISLALWVWAVTDTLVKPATEYHLYPNSPAR